MISAATVVVCALELLGRPASSVPPIRFLDVPPAGVSRNAEAFAVHHPQTIYLITSTEAFRDAQRQRDEKQCNTDSFRKIASVIVHEEWHLTHEGDEEGAYYAQLTTLNALGASSVMINNVRKAMFAAVDARKRQRKPDLLIARDRE